MNDHVLLCVRVSTTGIFLTFAFAGLLTTPPLTAQSPAIVPDTPVVGVGDVLSITVWRNPEMSGAFEVSEDGFILHPLYRSLRVVGLPLSAVEREVRGLLQRYEANPEFVVELSFRVFVGGQIRSPGSHVFSPQVTVAEAVARAGGVGDRARADRVRLLRAGGEVIIDLTQPQSELARTRVRSGDQIIVPARVNVWRDRISPVMGAVGSVASLTLLYLRLQGGRR